MSAKLLASRVLESRPGWSLPLSLPLRLSLSRVITRYRLVHPPGSLRFWGKALQDEWVPDVKSLSVGGMVLECELMSLLLWDLGHHVWPAGVSGKRKPTHTFDQESITSTGFVTYKEGKRRLKSAKPDHRVEVPSDAEEFRSSALEVAGSAAEAGALLFPSRASKPQLIISSGVALCR